MSLNRPIEICKTCDFYAADIYLNAPRQKGRCHRYPPRYQEIRELKFIPVLEGDWCGEYKRNLSLFKDSEK